MVNDPAALLPALSALRDGMPSMIIPRISRARRLPAPAAVLVRHPSPIGLTAVTLFAGPEAYHNPAAVWWGPCTFRPL